MSTTLEFVAKHRFARITARKAMRIADLIRGRDVNEALELLQFTPNRGAAFYSKVVKSAVANASMDEAINVNRLFVSEARADVGPLLNNRMRFRPGPQGRAMPFAKRLSHLTIKVKERADEDDTDSHEEAADEGSAGEGGQPKTGQKRGNKTKAKGGKKATKSGAKGGKKTAKKAGTAKGAKKKATHKKTEGKK
jgi:large subunit ribosomal protein L22